MTSASSSDSNRQPLESVTNYVYVYDAQNRLWRTSHAEVCPLDNASERCVEGPNLMADEPRPALTPAQPRVTHTFEFRLVGSETQEQCVPLASGLSPAELRLATQGVRAYLTRTGEPAAASSAIGGLEVAAELRRRHRLPRGPERFWARQSCRGPGRGGAVRTRRLVNRMR